MFGEESFSVLSSIAKSLSCLNSASSWEKLIDALDSKVRRKLVVLYSAEGLLLIKRGTSNYGKTAEGYNWTRETVLLERSGGCTDKTTAVLKASAVYHEWATSTAAGRKAVETVRV